jgi:hypothetical protein
MRSRSAFLALPLLLGPGVLAVFSGGYFGVARLTAAVAAWVLLAAAALAVPDPLPRSRAAWAALAGLALLSAWTAASLSWAPLGEPAGEDVQRALLYLPALAAGVLLLRAPAAARLAEPVLLGGIAGAVAYGLSERLLPGLVDLATVTSAGDRLAQPLTYWNATGAFAALGLVLAAGLAGDGARPPAVRAAAAALAPLLGLALFLTFSRGALGTLAAGLALLLALAPTAERLRAAALVAGAAALPALATVALPGVARAESAAGDGAAMLAVLLLTAGAAAALQRRLAARDAPVPRVRALALAALGVALVATAVAVAGIERRDDDGAARLASVQSNRYAYWKVAAGTFADHPLRGVGAGGFRVEWLRERPFRESVRDAHSLYLETAAELGLVGLAALALLLGGVVAAARRGGAVLAAPTAALGAWALHAGVDWDWEMPALTLVAVVLAGLVLATSPGPAAAPGARAP